MKLRGSVFIPLAIAVASIGAALTLFSAGSATYITVAQAKKLSGNNLNLGVDIKRDTLDSDFRDQSVEFMGTDKDGTAVKIRYVGEPVDLKNATKANCVGKFEGDIFVAHKMILKCPSKYEEQK
jgi:cytochrome c-type biogenesis protein CcmE